MVFLLWHRTGRPVGRGRPASLLVSGEFMLPSLLLPATGSCHTFFRLARFSRRRYRLGFNILLFRNGVADLWQWVVLAISSQGTRLGFHLVRIFAIAAASSAQYRRFLGISSGFRGSRSYRSSWAR